MNNLKVFENQQFGEIRVVEKDGEPWFVAADVCKAFGDTTRNRSMSRLDDDEKGYAQMSTPGGLQNIAVVNEFGLFSLLLAMQPTKARGISDKYIAERKEKLNQFRRWVTHDVLPSIRKYGIYAKEDLLANLDLTIEALQALKKEREEKALLEQENSRLSAANDLMSIENRTWEERTIINTLVPSIAGKRGVSIPSVYKELYRDALKKYHFDLPQRQQNWRKTHPEDKKHSALEFASEEEIHKLTVLCATEAYVMNVNMDKLLNEVNAKHAMELVELEERSYVI